MHTYITTGCTGNTLQRETQLSISFMLLCVATMQATAAAMTGNISNLSFTPVAKAMYCTDDRPYQMIGQSGGSGL